jgi:2-dehydro-3-deoxyphosphogalactonate aldolase
MRSLHDFETALRQLPLVAILRGLPPSDALSVGAALFEAGFRLIEVPLNLPEALQSIETLARELPDAVIGAGTVTEAEQVRQVQSAGGLLVVSPHLDRTVVEATVMRGLVSVPGVMTPSEAFDALRWGASALKVFPAEAVQPAALKALRTVLPAGARLLPVGGITPALLAPYRAAGADGFGLGSALYRPGDTTEQVGHQARAFITAWRDASR